MPRRNLEQLVAAARGTLVEGERVVGHGPCWAARLRRRVPLPLLGRRQFVLMLTDRRLLLFAPRRGRALQPSDLALGKRYETFSVERVHRVRPLLQVLVRATNGAAMVFEFRPRQRHLGEALVHHLGAHGAAPPAASGRPDDAAAGTDDAGSRDLPHRAP